MILLWKKNGFQFYLLVIISPGLDMPCHLRHLKDSHILQENAHCLAPQFTTRCSSCSILSPLLSPPPPSPCASPAWVITSTASLYYLPNLPTTRGMNTIPSALHLSLYFPILILKACWTPFAPSLATCPASCCWRGLTTETSRAASMPLAQKGSRTSAGRSSLPGRSPAGSFRGPRAAWNAAVRRMKWSIRNKK